MNKNLAFIVLLALILSTSQLVILRVFADTEPNDDFEQAELMAVGTHTGNLTAVDKNDYYKVADIKPGQEIVVRGTFIAEGKEELITSCGLTLYGVEKNKLANKEVDFGYRETDTPKTVTVSFTGGSQRDAYTYYIRAYMTYVFTYYPDRVIYSIDVSLVNHYDAGSETDAGDAFETALSITPDTYEGYVGKGDESDFYVINQTVNQGQVISVEATPDIELEIELCIYDPTRVEIAYDRSPSPGAMVRLNATAPSSGIYYIRVAPSVGYGDYSTEISIASPPVPAPTPPVADADGLYTGTEGVEVAFEGSASYDLDGTIASYEWDFGDGTTGTGITTTHTYAQDETYTVTLTVTDDDGLIDTDTTTTTIADVAPVADFSATPTTGAEPLKVEYTDLSTSYDSIISWSWSFGDGATSTDRNPKHVYEAEGTYTVSLTVSEEDADTDTEIKTEYITVKPPTTTPTPTPTTTPTPTPFLPIPFPIEFLGFGLALIVALSGGVGWMVRRRHEKRKRRKIKELLDEIDNVYSRFKMNARRCEAELYRLKDIIEEELKGGVIDEASYNILDKRVETYMKEIREQIISERLGGFPGKLRDELQKMVEKGEISKDAFQMLGKLIDRTAGLTESDRTELRELLEKWKEEYLKE